MEVSFLCHAHHCTLVQNRRPIQVGTWIDIHPAESFYVRISPMQPPNSTGVISDLTQHFDDLTLMQQVASTSVVSGLNPLAPEFTPGRSTIHTQPERLLSGLIVPLRGKKKQERCMSLHGLLRLGLACLDVSRVVRPHYLMTSPSGKTSSNHVGKVCWINIPRSTLLLFPLDRHI